MGQVVISMGEAGFGFDGTELVSLGLGSCVGIVMYEPGKKLSALGHIMLPDSASNSISSPKIAENILLAITEIGFTNRFFALLKDYNILTNETRKDGLFDRYKSVRPDMVILDNQIYPKGADVLRELVAMDRSARILMFCRDFYRELFTELTGLGAREIIFTPFNEDTARMLVKTSMNSHLLSYADIMIPYMIEKLAMMGADKSRLVAKIAGGAQMFSNFDIEDLRIGDRNISKVREILAASRIRIIGEDVGGTHGRSLFFDIGQEAFTVKSMDARKAV
jgi:chemotaxis receptor (MCP) glutamine deamidase CheD